MRAHCLRPPAVILLAVCACLNQPLLAEHTSLPELVIEGGGSRPALSLPSLGEARERLNRTPGGVDLIDSESYKTGRTSTLKDALDWSPGVFVQPRFGSEESRLSIRGSGLQRTFHLRGIKLLQDGVPLSQADGGGDFQAIEPLALRYIEVYRGANALQYGATTLGGAINFVSPSGYDASLFQARSELGSFGYRRGQLSSGSVVDDADYFVSLSHSEQDGFREDHSRQENQRLFANAGYRLTVNLETRFFLTALDSQSELPGNLTRAQLNDNPEQVNFFNQLQNYQRDFSLYRLANRTSYTFGNSRFDVSLFYTYKDLFHPIFQVLDIQSEDFGADFRFVTDAPLFGNRNIFTVGFTPVRGENEDNRLVNNAGIRDTRTGQSDQKAVNLDLYAENQHYITDRLALVTGAQFTHAKREFEDQFLSDGTDNSFDETYTAFSPKLGLRYEFTPDIQIFGNVSRSFEPPSFGELSGGPGITPVEEQTATTFEIGSRGNTERARWDIVYYRAWVEDELLSLNDAFGNPLGTVNGGDTLHQGLETGLSIDLLDSLELRQMYLWNDFSFDGHPLYNSNPIAGIPEHYYRAELLYHTPQGFYIGPNVEWVPDGYAVDHANTLFADSYAIMGMKAGYRSGRNLSLFIEGRNLTDRTYAATTGVIADAGGVDSAQFLPGDGRSVFVGFEWRQ